jgi:hypothetical protein
VPDTKSSGGPLDSWKLDQNKLQINNSPVQNNKTCAVVNACSRTILHGSSVGIDEAVKARG